MRIFMAFLLTLFMAASAKASEFHFLTDLPGEHPPLFDASWQIENTNIYFNGNTATDCTTGAAASVSGCHFEVTLPGSVPGNATHAAFRFKTSAQIPVPNVAGTAWKNAFIIAVAYDPATGTNSNHLAHTQVWAQHADGGSQNKRDIDYSQVWLPIIDGKVYVRLYKQVYNGGWLSFAATLEGYWTP